MDFYGFLLGTLCVWRFTHLLQAEDGPWDLMVRLRRLAGDGFWANLLDCFHCLSLWIAAPLACALGESLSEKFLLWPGLSAGAILLERITKQRQTAPPALYVEHEEDESDMLRQTESGISWQNPDKAGP